MLGNQHPQKQPPTNDSGSEVKVAQSCPTLCNPIDYTFHGIFQARILEWVAVPFSRGSSQPRDQPMALRAPALAGRALYH